MPLDDEELRNRGRHWEGWCPVQVAISAKGATFEASTNQIPVLDDDGLTTKFRANAADTVDPARSERLLGCRAVVAVLDHPRS